MKTGQQIRFNGIPYIFLGYTDYKRKWCCIADMHGNKATVYIGDLHK
jgi:hypothetical protein